MRRRHFPIVALALLAAALPAAAQVLDRPTLYRLDRGSTFQRGCFPPCECPMMQTVPVTGTFRLELVSVGNVFDFYEVKGVRLTVRLSNTDTLRITGSGTYAVSTIADLQRMELELAVGDEPPTVYRSDDVAGGAAFPRIAVPISIHGGFCHDTVIDLRARPARRLHVDSSVVAWDGNVEAAAPASDVVMGDLGTLRGTGGSFDVATWGCVANDSLEGSIESPDFPDRGQGFWFLERADGESYADADAAQVGSPDEGIAASPGACP